MGKKNIPGALVDAETYINGSNNLAGISEAELPKVEFATVTSEQFGLTAEVEVPLVGHLKKMDFKLKIEHMNETMGVLATDDAIMIELKGASQELDSETHGRKIVGVYAVIKGLIKSYDGPKMKSGDKMETSVEMSVTYYELKVNGKQIYKIDVFNGILEAGGKSNSEIRRFLGLI